MRGEVGLPGFQGTLPPLISVASLVNEGGAMDQQSCYESYYLAYV